MFRNLRVEHKNDHRSAAEHHRHSLRRSWLRGRRFQWSQGHHDASLGISWRRTEPFARQATCRIHFVVQVEWA